MAQSIADLRSNYSLRSLLESEVDNDPITQFAKWWEEAMAANLPEPNAMTLATASADGMPSARIVLLKNFDQKGFSFFSNYNSYKGKQLEENPRACLVFLWKELERQVRISGLVEKLDEKANDIYFHSRPLASQIGATISPQSQVIDSREWLRQNFTQAEKTYTDQPVPRPAYWGGYLVKPFVIEFWQGQPGRLHDRLQYSLLDSGNWKIERLAP